MFTIILDILNTVIPSSSKPLDELLTLSNAWVPQIYNAMIFFITFEADHAVTEANHEHIMIVVLEWMARNQGHCAVAIANNIIQLSVIHTSHIYQITLLTG